MLAAASNTDLVEWLRSAGSLGLLAFAVVGFLRGWIVPGSRVRELRAERDKALELVYRQAQLAERALEVSERRSAR